MKIEKKDFPVLTATRGRATEMFVGVEKLKESGAFANASLSVGDKIEIPDEIHVSTQEVRSGGPKAFMIGVRKNDKPAWLSIGSLRRRDAQNTPIGTLSEVMAKFDNDYDRAMELKGKTVTVYAKPKVLVAKFDNDTGQRIGEEEREVAMLQYA